MSDYEQFVLARVLHVVAIVMWIGGVAFVTTVLIPSLKLLPNEQDRMQMFERLEGRFALQAKLTTLLTGISGLWMLDYLDAWSRYFEPQFWWLHLMTFIWFIFSLVLFVLEPLFLHKLFHLQFWLGAPFFGMGTFFAILLRILKRYFAFVHFSLSASGYLAAA